MTSPLPLVLTSALSPPADDRNGLTAGPATRAQDVLSPPTGLPEEKGHGRGAAETEEGHGRGAAEKEEGHGRGAAEKEEGHGRGPAEKEGHGRGPAERREEEETASPRPTADTATAATHLPTHAPTAAAAAASLLNISIVDFLEVDSRPSLIARLAASPSAENAQNAQLFSLPAAGDIIYYNPALRKSSALRQAVASSTGALGSGWTRTVLNDFVVFTADGPGWAARAPETAAKTVVLETSPAITPPSDPSLGAVSDPTTTASARAIIASPSPTTTPPEFVTPPSQRRQPPTPPTSAVFAPRDHSNGHADHRRSSQDGSGHGFTAEPLSLSPDEAAPAALTGPATRRPSLDDYAYARQVEAITGFMPVGVCVLDLGTNVLYANPAWYHIMGCAPPPPGTHLTRDVFFSYIVDEDQPVVRRLYNQIRDIPITFGLRLKKYVLPQAFYPGQYRSPDMAMPPATAASRPSMQANGDGAVDSSSSISGISGSNDSGSNDSGSNDSGSNDSGSNDSGSNNNLSASAASASSTALTASTISTSTTASTLSTTLTTASTTAASTHVPLTSPDIPETSELVPEGSHILATAVAVKDDDGNLRRILVCLRDIAEHRNIIEAADRHAQQANNLRRMAEFATVGMYGMDLHGHLHGANRVFYEMCGIEDDKNETGDQWPKQRPQEKQEKQQPHQPQKQQEKQQQQQPENQCYTAKSLWQDCVVDEDQPLLKACVDRLVNEGNPHQSAEVRFKKPWITEDGAGNQIVAPRWVEATFLPVLGADGKVHAITGCLSDVSLRKWQLERERQIKEEAIESKRQQENFVDMTSHEIRNPLTVIMHCGDAVLECLTSLRAQYLAEGEGGGDGRSATDEGGPGKEEGDSMGKIKSLLDDGIDYAEIIVGTALHQKAIVDDILTMSKLDSELLAVTPVVVDPVEIVHSTLRMFEVQARLQHIVLYMDVDPSFGALFERPYPALSQSQTQSQPASPPPPHRPQLLEIDPARVKQILINLLTNALKFTRAVDVREVTIRISASRTRPTDETCSVSFVPRAIVPAGSSRVPWTTKADRRRRRRRRSKRVLNGEAGAGEIGEGPGEQEEEEDEKEEEREEDYVFLIFEVIDTGEGLTPAGVESLFQKFVQVNSNTHVKHGGSGLGLFISKQLVELQGGAIGVASRQGVGSTFAFYIEAYIPPPNTVPSAANGTMTPEDRYQYYRKQPNVVPGAADDGRLSETIPHTTAERAVPAVSEPTTTPTPSSPTNMTTPQSPSPQLSPADTATGMANGTRKTSEEPVLALASGHEEQQQQQQQAPPVPPQPEPPLLASVPPTPPHIRGVLLVEDNIVNQKVARRYFERKEVQVPESMAAQGPVQVQVQVAANGIEAIEKIRQSDRVVAGGFPISIVLMDMDMPVQDGLTCTRNIRAMEAAGELSGGRLPILMLTGNGRPEQIADARTAGCDDVMVKPFQMQPLMEHIQRIMRTLWEADRQAQQQAQQQTAVAAGAATITR